MEEKITSKKELKQKTQEMKFAEKQRRLEEKQAIKEEKERRKNSFGRKFKNFIWTIIFVIILLGVGFYFGKQFLKEKEKELSNKKMSQIYQSALNEYDNKNYKHALDILNSIDKTYSKYEEVKEKINEIENLYLNEYLTEADSLLKNKEYDKAISTLEKIEPEYLNKDLIQNKIAEIKTELLKNAINELEKNKSDTIDILEYIVKFKDENIKSIIESKDALISQYKNAFLLETRKMLETDYFKAKTNIEKAKELLPDDKDIKSLVHELETSTPTSSSLLDQEYSITNGKLNISNGSNKITSKDSKKEYTKYILKSASSSGNEDSIPYRIKFKLDKSYKKFTGIICISDEDNTKPVQPAKITIYDGEKMIYYSDKINDETFDIDIKNVEELTIEFEGITKESYFIANPELTPIN